MAINHPVSAHRVKQLRETTGCSMQDAKRTARLEVLEHELTRVKSLDQMRDILLDVLSLYRTGAL